MPTTLLRAGWMMALALLLLASPGLAQEQGASPAAPPRTLVPAAFESPSATILTFVVAMGKTTPDMKAGIECMDMSGIPREAAADLALKLYKSINRIEFIDFEDDPTLLNLESLALEEHQGLARWTFFPREKAFASGDMQYRYDEVMRLAPEAKIELARDANGAWRFTASTVSGIEDLWDNIGRKLQVVDAKLRTEYKTIAELIEDRWPEYFVENAFLRIKYWQWMSMLMLVFMGVVLDLMVRIFLSSFSRRIISRKGGEASSDTLKKTVRPFGLAVAALFWLFSIHLLGLPSASLLFIIPAVKLFAMLATVWAAYRVTDLVSEVLLSKAAKTESKFDDLLVPLASKTAKIFITIFGLIYIADSLNVPLAPLLTGLGIGGMGFAIAAKDTIEHFFGSITVIADRPFQVGDWVKIGDSEGTVEVIGFRSTRIRTFYNSLLTVPNGNLVRAVVDNYGLRKYRRWTTHLNLTYDTSPEKIEAFCEGIRELIRVHPYTRKDYYQVWIHGFGPHSLDVLVYLFFEAPDWQTELRERHRMILDIIRLADRLGVEFAFPTQTLHLYKQEGGQTHQPAALPASQVESKNQDAGRKAVQELIANADWRTKKPAPYVFTDAGSMLDPNDESQIETKVGRA